VPHTVIFRGESVECEVAKGAERRGRGRGRLDGTLTQSNQIVHVLI